MIHSKQLTYSKQRLNVSLLRHAQRTLCLTLLTLTLPVQALEINQLEQVTPNFPSFTFLDDAEVTADGKLLVFSGDARLRSVDELFSMPVGGSEDDIVRLSIDLIDGGDVSNFELSPDGKTVIYLADAMVDGRTELFSVPVSGGESTRLNPSLDSAALSNRRVRTPIILEPSGQHVIYRLDLSVEEEFEFFRVPLAGGDSVRLSDGNTGFRPRLSPDGKSFVFTSDQRFSGIFELFSVPVDGGVDDIRTLHPPLDDNQTILNLRVSPDSQTVIYEVQTGERSFNRREELFSTSIDGSNANVFRPLVQDYPSDTGDITGFEITPDGNSVIYLSDQLTDSAQELFRVSINGSADGSLAVKLSNDALSSGRVSEFKISPKGDRVLYIADDITTGFETLFVVPINGDSDDVQPLEAESNINDVVNFVISGDGRNVIYEKLIDVDKTIQLFITPIGAQQQPVAFSMIFGDPDDNEEGQVLKLSGKGTQLSYIPPDGRRAFAATVALPANNEDEFCLPITAQNGNVIVICL
ncbi:MAG: hypothetical protein KTR16_06940 [Acidiferrobacterales bacterium]|nr:hypothetical protein [Acidiferrobacterales bacterium]